MKRVLPLAILAGLGIGATALAAQGDNPYDSPEPDVTAARVLKLPDSAPGCGSTRNATVRVLPPTGAILGYVRIVVDDRQAARLTGVPRAASATVRIPQAGARLSVTGETLGGQRMHVTRVYSDCTRPPDTGGGGGGGGQVGAGEG
jgi:predicted membrane-bound mannosyltransferase